MEAILALADRVTADSPREAPAPQPLALHFPGGVIGLQSTVSVGADTTNQVVLEDRYVSRFHCRLLPHGGRWLLKERASHEVSDRSGGPFVPLNFGAVSRELAEAELFGHEKGAFTGAITSAPGAFGAADGGTLFLDEIADLPSRLQVTLLRALEAGEVKPVGAPKPRCIDVRVVCATHQDLRLRVREGAFREDLFYRLRGVTVELPPLRARPRDVLPLAEHFLPPRTTLSSDARAALLSHSWPGNVRELRHVVQLAALLSESKVIRAHALHFDGQPAASPRVCDAADGAGRDPQGVDLRG